MKLGKRLISMILSRKTDCRTTTTQTVGARRQFLSKVTVGASIAGLMATTSSRAGYYAPSNSYLLGRGPGHDGFIALPATACVIDTQILATQTSFPSYINVISTEGYNTFGDGGGAVYIRYSGTPSNPGRFQSADGSWWVLAYQTVTPRMFGAAGSNASNPVSNWIGPGKRFANLAALQVYYPWVTSTSDEIDYAAIQAASYECFGSQAAPLATGAPNKQLHITAGVYVTNKTILFWQLNGAVIFGDGAAYSNGTTIVTSGDVGIFKTIGATHTDWRDINLLNQSVGSTTALFDLDCNATGIQIAFNKFSDMAFQGGLVGCRVAFSGYQGDTNTWVNCLFINSASGIKTCATNALCNNAIGCGFIACGIAIWCYLGSIGVIDGCTFEQSTNWDLQLNNGAGAQNVTVISGVRSESVSFLNNGVCNVILNGVSHFSAGGAGVFVQGVYKPVEINSCTSRSGTLSMPQGGTIRNSQFGPQNPMVQATAGYVQIENVGFGYAANWGDPALSPITYVSGALYGDGTNPWVFLNQCLPPAKFTSASLSAGTLAAGLITGAANVVLSNTGTTPGNQTVRTAAQMLADIPGANSGFSYCLRVINNGSGTLTLSPDVGGTVTISGTATVAGATFRDFIVTFTSASTATIQSVS